MGKKENIFSILSQDMYDIHREGAALEDCFSGNASLLQATPLRYRIIALGFLRHMSVAEVNRKLEENGCPALYSRNMWESTLIFALQNGMSYENWRALAAEIRGIVENQSQGEWFCGSKITYRELEEYVLKNSVQSGDLLKTEARTHYLDVSLAHLGSDAASLCKFVQSNVRSFSLSREKTRYYFCKYLYYYLNTKIENYFAACQRRRGIDEALSELSALKVITKLRRNLTMPEGEKRALIADSALSCGELFDAFNFFFFGYVSLDWADVLLEGCDDIESLNPALRKALADKFRKENKDWKRLSDAEVIAEKLRDIEHREETPPSESYGKNRVGEWTLSKFIKGTLDIDRTVLICFLLFFASNANLPQEHRLTEERLQQILLSCGYPRLDIENDFDWFAVEFLESRRPQDLLNDLITEFASRQKNSFLYRIYSGAVSYNAELEQTML